ncbi:substrate-binding periplasmic protein [Aquipseudomonas ullengensis]|uniref:Transporter substrate-binding domain-containing protein n=1 Tax=Aquipseudomonas ullengensis TaxID=2759166 RepID=A0A7W4Q864_9GAMM|nr:transporter substrate-binding domain-containing protein [Pseudomonas ullengensis]MBB2493427.1 transporter substrate-binding domain-containing protein [Pseudomonas ullengensis]
MKARLAFLSLLCIFPGLALAADPITVAWRNKAPYHYVEQGVEQGFLLERARQVFAAAGIETQFVQHPAKRIWHSFEQGTRNYCSFGWYRLPERERIALFSQTFHTDAPQIVLASTRALSAIQAHPSFADLLQDKRITLGLLDGVSYGPSLDQLIAGSANHIQHATVEPAVMMRMVAAHRVDYMLADQADWDYLHEHKTGLDGIVEQHFADMPAGLERFIICSKDVSPDVMTRINQAITQLPQ